MVPSLAVHLLVYAAILAVGLPLTLAGLTHGFWTGLAALGPTCGAGFLHACLGKRFPG